MQSPPVSNELISNVNITRNRFPSRRAGARLIRAGSAYGDRSAVSSDVIFVTCVAHRPAVRVHRVCSESIILTRSFGRLKNRKIFPRRAELTAFSESGGRVTARSRASTARGRARRGDCPDAPVLGTGRPLTVNAPRRSVSRRRITS
ncbi:hypothetical protein EVAR_86192_1 [Eumeta japonica]|uniref:Uncharacterized protein n=1 Tax=Eumeta variegata TaxID=151549 RepID=A0A4C1UCG3_EUMVA|nr:hypothetical protein EVAR_86192_1 [Eumeta japonica]